MPCFLPFVWLKKRDHLLELGTGSGVISLILARRWCCGRWSAQRFRRIFMKWPSAMLNWTVWRIRSAWFLWRQENWDLLKAQSFDTVVFNPPYRRMNSGRMNPDDQRAMARHEIKGTLDDFLKAAAYVLKESGRVFIIYPAAHMVELFDRMRTFHLEPKRVKIVYSHDDSRENSFLPKEGKRAGSTKVLPPLFYLWTNGRIFPSHDGYIQRSCWPERIPQAPPDSGVEVRHSLNIFLSEALPERVADFTFDEATPGHFLGHDLLRISLNSSSVTEATLFRWFFYLAILIQNFLDQGGWVVFFHDRSSHFINGEEDILDRIIFIFRLISQDILFKKVELLHPDGICDLDKEDISLSRRVSYKQKFRTDDFKPDLL